MARQSALRSSGSTALWRKIRSQVLKRDQDTCYYCGQYADTVEHLIERSQGGTDSMDNLVAACKKCNYSRVGNKTGAFFKSASTPMTPLASFTPKNEEISHYQIDSD
jgi:5-methylcytosine-specific restriction endonuclease McrA